MEVEVIHVNKGLEESYKASIIEVNSSIDKLEEDYFRLRKELRKDLAEVINEAKFEADISILESAKLLGKSKQAINQLLVAHYGVRFEDKAALAKKGWEKRKSVI